MKSMIVWSATLSLLVSEGNGGGTMGADKSEALITYYAGTGGGGILLKNYNGSKEWHYEKFYEVTSGLCCDLFTSNDFNLCPSLFWIEFTNARNARECIYGTSLHSFSRFGSYCVL